MLDYMVRAYLVWFSKKLPNYSEEAVPFCSPATDEGEFRCSTTSSVFQVFVLDLAILIGVY